MTSRETVEAFLAAFRSSEPRDAFVGEEVRLAGEAHGAPVLAFAVPGATIADLETRNMAITFDEIEVGSEERVLVWGAWTADGTDPQTYHVVLVLQGGVIVEARFFDGMEQARWFAGL